MKNIGIVTYYKIYNYGSILQAYALTKKVESLGYKAEIIDYLDYNQQCFKKIKNRTYLNRILVSLKSPFLLYNTLNTKKKGNSFMSGITEDHKKKFDDFLNKNFTLSKVDILKDKNYYSSYICGSDQVWQLSAPGLHELYYLRFTSKDKRIAYAPSFGSLTIPWYNKRRLKEYLSEFNYLSVREDSGVEVVKKSINKNIPQVLDPVLLMDSNFWKDKWKINTMENNYILCYFLGDITKYEKIIDSYKQKLNANIIIIDGGKINKIDGKYIKASPEEFVNLMRNASFVITDSLHGTEFAITFEKQFLVLERNYITVPEQNTRLISLLRMLNLQDRYINDNQTICLDLTPINYIKVNEKLTHERIKSNEYLVSALKNSIR